MRYFHSKKWSEFCASRRFQRRTTFRDILEKKFFSPNNGNKMPDDSVNRVDSKSARIMSLSHSFPVIFDVKDSKNSLRHNCNHYVIIIIITSKFALALHRAFSSIPQKVDEIFSFWKVIWILLIKTLLAANDFSWYLRKQNFFPQ